MEWKTDFTSNTQSLNPPQPSPNTPSTGKTPTRTKLDFGKVVEKERIETSTRGDINPINADELLFEEAAKKHGDLKKWSIHIPIKFIAEEGEAGKGGNLKGERLIRLSIESDFDRPFPQSHKIVIMDPSSENIFFHWTLNLTPFTYQSIMKGKSLPPMAGNSFKETFRRFSFLIQQCANDIANNPTRFQASLRFLQNDTMATLEFHETVNGYRKIELMSLDFIKSSWNDLKTDISKYAKEILIEHEDVKANLIQVMDTISLHQPNLLMACNELYQPIKTYQPKIWTDAQKRMAHSHLESFEDRIRMAEKFLKETDKQEIQNDLVHVKTMSVPIHDSSASEKEVLSTRELAFSFYFRSNDYGRKSYQIIITDPTDLFFHFNSIEITPELFHLMTESIHVVNQEKANSSSKSKVKPSTFSRFHGNFTNSTNSGNDNESVKDWFNDVHGTRSVVGVVAGDFMTGVNVQPDRYQVKLCITKPVVEVQNNTRKPEARGINNRKKMNLEQEPTSQPALRAVLKFSEYFFYQSRPALQIEFRETPLTELNSYIQARFSQTKFQISITQEKLSALLKVVATRNMALFSLLDRPRRTRNRDLEERPPAMYDQNHRYGYEREREEDETTAKEGKYPSIAPPEMGILGPDTTLIPQRSVVMRIPVQRLINPKEERKRRENRLYKPPSNIDAWFKK